MVSGVNLPAAQLQVAMGVPLHRNPDIRMMYGLDKYGTTDIDFASPKVGYNSSLQHLLPTTPHNSC